MTSLRELRSHIRSVQDTKKITNAMYFIASTKLRKARAELDSTRPFFDAMKREIKRVFRTVERIDSPFFFPEDGSEYPKGRCGCLVITADKGLAGDYNINVIREALRLRESEPDMRFFIAGEFGRRYFKEHGIPFEEGFQFSDQRPTIQMAREICAEFLPPFQRGEMLQIYIVYTDMKNSLKQIARSERLLPFHHDRFLSPPEERAVEEPFEFLPSVESVLNSAVPCYLVGFIYSALVDSYCSEQNARMLSMRSANENADRILQELGIQYNRARQSAITQEITEISSGARAQRQRRKGEGAK